MASQEIAYITGGASGIGRALAEHLVGKKGMTVLIADLNLTAAQEFVETLNKQSTRGLAHLAVQTDVTSWESQAEAFETAIKHAGGRIHHVYAIAGLGEKLFLPFDAGLGGAGFVKPNMNVLDVDLNGVVYTVALAVQHFRAVSRGEGERWRGRITTVASVCGFYCVPTLPIYTAAKHAVNGFVRSYGKYLPEEGISLNALAPNVVRTSISTEVFYDDMERKGLLTPMEGVIEAFDEVLNTDISGEILEIGPNGGFARRAPPEYLDEKSEAVCRVLRGRGYAFQAGEKKAAA